MDFFRGGGMGWAPQIPPPTPLGRATAVLRYTAHNKSYIG